MLKLTEFGKKLPPEQQEQALAIAHIGELLRQAKAEVYPDAPPWHKWTPAQWDEIYARADELWLEEKDGGHQV